MPAARVSGSRPSASAFSNVPDAAMVDTLLGRARRPGITRDGRPRVPRDAGAGWDFEDVRDHYVRLLFGVDPVRPAGARRGSLPRAWPCGDWRGDAENVRRVATPRFLVSRRARLVRARSFAGSGLGDRRFGRPAEGGLLVSEARVCPGGARCHRRGTQRPSKTNRTRRRNKARIALADRSSSSRRRPARIRRTGACSWSAPVKLTKYTFLRGKHVLVSVTVGDSTPATPRGLSLWASNAWRGNSACIALYSTSAVRPLWSLLFDRQGINMRPGNEMRRAARFRAAGFHRQVGDSFQILRTAGCERTSKMKILLVSSPRPKTASGRR